MDTVSLDDSGRDSCSTGFESSSPSSLSNSDNEDNVSCESSHHEPSNEKGKPNLVINTRQLWNEINKTAQWGAIAGTSGIARLSLSNEDRCVRDYFVSETTKMGCQVTIDQMGNIFAVLPGENDEIPPIGIGSHLDTQPAGGRFDGILGVLGAVEVLKTIKNSNQKTYAPLAAINWTNEEGARFTPGCSGSAVWAGHTLLSQAHAVSDSSSARSIKQELERIRYLGSEPADYRVNQLSAHFELHIEQQRILQDAQKKIGIVKSIQGIRWYRIHVHGQRAHAGSTPMDQRADAMVAAANLILFLEKRACGVVAVATTGVVELDRPSPNTVPGEVLLTLDLRHPCEAELDGFETAMRLYVSEFEVEHPKIQINTTRIWRSPAAKMNDFAVSCARRAAERIVGEENVMDTTSLAGHDSALTSTRVPTSMIFVPSKDGMSHAPEEFTSEEQCGAGVQVLLEAVLEYDLSLRHAI